MNKTAIRNELLDEIIAEIDQTIAFFRKNVAELSGHECEPMDREIVVLEGMKSVLAAKRQTAEAQPNEQNSLLNKNQAGEPHGTRR